MCFSPWGKNIPWCRNVQNALLSNMFLQQGDNVNFSLFSLHHRSHETGKSIEPSSWDASDFYPVKDCSVLFLNPRVHYMVITWRCREGAAPTETNHQVAISFLIKWLLPVFFLLHAFSKRLVGIHVRLQLICLLSEQHSRGQGNGFRLMVSILHDSVSANLINTLCFFLFFLLNRQGS